MGVVRKSRENNKKAHQHPPAKSVNKNERSKGKGFFFSAARSTDGQKYKTKACMRFSSVLPFPRRSTQEKILRELR